MKLYNFTLQRNLNHYFIVIYTQINFRLFKNFNFLPKNFLKKYKSLVWLDFNYKFEPIYGVTYLTKVFKKDFNTLSLKVFCNTTTVSKYTKYLEISLLNFNINRSVFDQLKITDLKDGELATSVKFEYNFLSILLNGIKYNYTLYLFSKIKYLLLFKNFNNLYHLNCKYINRVSLHKNQLSLKPTFNLNFKFL
jgi:hypothetical protein